MLQNQRRRSTFHDENHGELLRSQDSLEEDDYYDGLAPRSRGQSFTSQGEGGGGGGGMQGGRRPSGSDAESVFYYKGGHQVCLCVGCAL